MSARTGGPPPHTPDDARPARAPAAAGAVRAGAPTIALDPDSASVASPPAYADVVALVPALRGRPSAPNARLEALASLATQAELGAVAAPETPEARVRSAYLVLAETARALFEVLRAPSVGGGPGVRDPRADPDAGARSEPAARVAQMAARLGARVPDEGFVAPAHALCAEVEASLR